MHVGRVRGGPTIKDSRGIIVAASSGDHSLNNRPDPKNRPRPTHGANTKPRVDHGARFDRDPIDLRHAKKTSLNTPHPKILLPGKGELNMIETILEVTTSKVEGFSFF